MRRREMRQMESLGKGQACVYEAKGRQDGSKGEIRPQGLWTGVTQNERKTLDLGISQTWIPHSNIICVTLNYYLISLSLFCHM